MVLRRRDVCEIIALNFMDITNKKDLLLIE